VRQLFAAWHLLIASLSGTDETRIASSAFFCTDSLALCIPATWEDAKRSVDIFGPSALETLIHASAIDEGWLVASCWRNSILDHQLLLKVVPGDVLDGCNTNIIPEPLLCVIRLLAKISEQGRGYQV